MDEEQFLDDMRDEFGTRKVTDLADALYHAMERVGRQVVGGEAVYFGEVGDGVFFSAGDFESCRWLPGYSAAEAITHLACDPDVDPEHVEAIRECEEACWY